MLDLHEQHAREARSCPLLVKAVSGLLRHALVAVRRAAEPVPVGAVPRDPSAFTGGNPGSGGASRRPCSALSKCE